jgi:hypothetical protein
MLASRDKGSRVSTVVAAVLLLASLITGVSLLAKSDLVPNQARADAAATSSNVDRLSAALPELLLPSTAPKQALLRPVASAPPPTSVSHLLFYTDSVGDAAHLDIAACMLGIDDTNGLLAFSAQFVTPFVGFGAQDQLMFLIDTDFNSTTGLAGAEYKVSLSYDSTYGSYYAQIVNLVTNSAQLVYYFVDTAMGIVDIFVPDYLLPNHHNYRWFAISANPVAGVYDAIPNDTSFVYADPDLYPTTTTLPATTTTTMPPTTTTTMPQGQQFSDVPAGHPYSVQIADLAYREIVGGFPGGAFRPQSWVTRQQFAKMIVLTMDYDVPPSMVCPFTDVDLTPNPFDPLYPAKYVAVCALYGITAGYPDHTFRPLDSISRQQLITMVVRGADLPDPPDGYTPPFSRGQFSLNEHYLNARKAARAGLLDGLEDVGLAYGFLNPATRGEVCVLLYNLLNR